MLERARRFLQTKKPTLAEARTGLLLAYFTAFAFQVVVALLLGGLVALGVSPRETPSVPLERNLFGLGLALLPVAALSATLIALKGGKGRALFAALLLGGLLAAPVWFALLLVAVGGFPLRLLALLLVFFPLGALVSAGYAALALREARPTA